jgi:hypothetical protein
VIKGQVTGPVSWGLVVGDQDRKPVLYDDILAEAVAKHLRLKATWMEQKLRKLAAQTILMVDEPYMSSFGSAFVSLNRDQAVALMEEVLAGIEGLKGVHCCGNTDWSLMLSTTADILSLDAYEYAESLALYPDEVGLKQDDLLAAALIMPSCGCGSLPVKTAEQVLGLTGAVAKALQERYG